MDSRGKTSGNEYLMEEIVTEKTVCLGDTIDVSDDQALWSIDRQMEDANVGAKMAWNVYRIASKAFWEYVWTVYPELSDFHLTLNREDKVLVVVGKK